MGMVVEAVTSRRREFMAHLGRQAVANAMAIHDLRHMAPLTRCWMASMGARPRGYLMVWAGRKTPSVILRGSAEAVDALLRFLPGGSYTVLTDPPLAQAVAKGCAARQQFRFTMMAVDGRGFRPRPTGGTRRLRGDDAASLAKLYGEAGLDGQTDWKPWITGGIAHGAFEDQRLVAVAGTHYLSDDHALLGGVYTALDRRRRGLGAGVVSAVTGGVLGRLPRVILMVVSSNVAALELYRALGYQAVKDWAWLGVGNVAAPLT